MKTQHKGSGVVLNILVLLNIVAVLSLFCSYAAHYIDPRESWVFALFGLMYPWILILNAGFVVVWLILRKVYALLSLAAILIGWNQLNSMIALNFGNRVIPPGQHLNLITYNLHGFTGQAVSRGDARMEIVEYLSGEGPDILCLQEFHIRESETDPLIEKMASTWEMPFYFIQDYYQSSRQHGLNGIATFSRFPIVAKGTLEYQPGKRFAIYTDIVMPSDTVRVFNVHLASIRLGQKDVDFYYQLKKNETENVNVKAGIFSILHKLKAAFLLRSSQTERLLRAVDSSPYPVLVCGDLNDSPFSYTYRQLTRTLSDAYKEAGRGFFGNTYDGVLPNYRIDYILHDEHFRIYTYNKSTVGFSDHYPVSGLIMFK